MTKRQKYILLLIPTISVCLLCYLCIARTLQHNQHQKQLHTHLQKYQKNQREIAILKHHAQKINKLTHDTSPADLMHFLLFAAQKNQLHLDQLSCDPTNTTGIFHTKKCHLVSHGTYAQLTQFMSQLKRLPSLLHFPHISFTKINTQTQHTLSLDLTLTQLTATLPNHNHFLMPTFLRPSRARPSRRHPVALSTGSRPITTHITPSIHQSTHKDKNT